MATEFRLSAIYLNAEYREKFYSCVSLGWAESRFVTQCLHYHMARYWEYYATVMELDAPARGMVMDDYYDYLFGSDFRNLGIPPYVGDRPVFPPSPIARVAAHPQTKENQLTYANIPIGEHNYVLLRAGFIADGGPLTQLASRIVIDHLQACYEKNYRPMIEAHRLKSPRRIYDRNDK